MEVFKIAGKYYVNIHEKELKKAFETYDSYKKFIDQISAAIWAKYWEGKQ